MLDTDMHITVRNLSLRRHEQRSPEACKDIGAVKEVINSSTSAEIQAESRKGKRLGLRSRDD